METLKQWAVGVTMASFSGGLIYMLSPRGKMDRAVRCAVSIFILSVFIAPIFGGATAVPDFDISDPPPVSSAMGAEVSELLAREAETLLVGAIRGELEGLGAQASSIRVEADIDSEGGIYIETVEVILTRGSACGAAQAEQRLEAALGIQAVSVKKEGAEEMDNG